MKMIDRKYVMVVLLVLLAGTTWAQHDVRFDSYGSWSKTPTKSQVVWINGMLSGVHYLAVRYATEQKDSRIIQYVPNEVSSLDIQTLIDFVYQYDDWKPVPVVDMVIRYQYWVEKASNRFYEEEGRRGKL